ncbi:MAG: ferredoxin [Bacteroidales bacterium 55_9]|nr:MAG: ferredoxin [Bacteroidales bacterium 55_9]
MVINERDIRNETVRAAAQAVMAAARTAPKAKGRDMVEVAVVTEEDIERLAETMVLMSGESGMKFLLRDADGLNCGYCGYPTCTAKPAQAPCMMNGVDVGIAIGSACAAATDMRVDTRVMFSAGWAARRMRLLGDADIVFAIPMSVSSKNPFFDRKSPAAKNTENAETKK